MGYTLDDLWDHVWYVSTSQEPSSMKFENNLLMAVFSGEKTS